MIEYLADSGRRKDRSRMALPCWPGAKSCPDFCCIAIQECNTMPAQVEKLQGLNTTEQVFKRSS
jgi:hypothetical protein